LALPGHGGADAGQARCPAAPGRATATVGGGVGSCNGAIPPAPNHEALRITVKGAPDGASLRADP